MRKLKPLPIKSIIITLSICLSTFCVATPALAATGQVYASTGWYEQHPSPVWWGAAFVEVSELCAWVDAESRGLENLILSVQVDWSVNNTVSNTAYAGITGYGTLETTVWFPAAECNALAWGKWDGSGAPIQDQADIDPHPYAPDP